jgi:hypothetical protein
LKGKYLRFLNSKLNTVPKLATFTIKGEDRERKR